MAKIRTPLGGEEFMRKILEEDERDFSCTIMEEGFDFSGHEMFPEFNNYLKRQDLECNPIILSGSEFHYVKMNEIYLPYVVARNTNFEGANLEDANLKLANLYKSNFRWSNLEDANLNGVNLKLANLDGSNLEDANLEDANLERAIFYLANLNGANLKLANLNGANLKLANLERAIFYFTCLEDTNLDSANLRGTIINMTDLREVRNLEYTFNLGHAIFKNTRVNKREKVIISNALNIKPDNLDNLLRVY